MSRDAATLAPGSPLELRPGGPLDRLVATFEPPREAGRLNAHREQAEESSHPS
jgi:hypothetical protein